MVSQYKRDIGNARQNCDDAPRVPGDGRPVPREGGLRAPDDGYVARPLTPLLAAPEGVAGRECGDRVFGGVGVGGDAEVLDVARRLLDLGVAG